MEIKITDIKVYHHSLLPSEKAVDIEVFFIAKNDKFFFASSSVFTLYSFLPEDDVKAAIYKEIVERAREEYKKWKLRKEEEAKLLTNYLWVRQLKGNVPEVYILSDKLEEKPK